MELKEQIARAMYYQHISPECKWENEGQWFRDKYLDFADQIIALILKIRKDNPNVKFEEL